MSKDVFRPIIGIENRTAQEVFDIMCDRFRALQSLSTQQPMGEITWERMARAQSRKLQAVLHVPGVKDVLHELDWENGDPLDGWDFVRRSALHPNQESGE